MLMMQKESRRIGGAWKLLINAVFVPGFDLTPRLLHLGTGPGSHLQRFRKAGKPAAAELK